MHMLFTPLFMLLLLSGCGGQSTDTPPVKNVIPIANAYINQTVSVGATVTLDASFSSDANSDSLTYLWRFISKPTASVATLSDANSKYPSFVADEAGTYLIGLIVNDGQADSLEDSVTITATSSTNNNVAPVANANVEQTVKVGATVVLDGALSSDANSDTLTYAWTLSGKPSGSNANLLNATTVNPSFVADVSGIYQLILIVNDGALSSAADSVTVTALLINDNLQTKDAAIWQVSDGWSNGSPFISGWCQTQVLNDANGLQLSVANTACSGESYASGEYRTQNFLSYGRVEVDIKAASGAGIVSSLFFYTGPSDNGNEHEEIDIEFLGQNTNQMQVNYWTVEAGVEKEHPTLISLGFDAAADFHRYAIDWRSDSIKWYVDNVLVHTEDGSKGKLPLLDMRLFMNTWACSAASWCGVLLPANLPSQVQYRNLTVIQY